MESYSVKAILTVTDQNFTKTISAAISSLGDLDSSTTKSSTSVASFASAFAIAEKAVSAVATAIKSSLSSAISRVDTLNQYPKVMEALGYSAEAAEESINKLSDGIDGLPTTLDDIVSSAQLFAATLGDLDKATDTAIAVNDLFIAAGASTSEATYATQLYNKALAAGSVTSTTWLAITSRAPGQFKQLAETMLGAGSTAQDLYSALGDGTITMEELNDCIIQLDQEGGESFASFAEQAQSATSGIGTAMQNLSTAVVRGMANVIQAIDDALEANGMPTIAEQINSAKTVINAAFSAVQTGATGLVNVLSVVAKNFDVVVAAATPVVTAMVALKVVDTVKTKFSNFKTAGEQAAKALEQVRDASQLAEKAVAAKSDALEAATKAEKLHTTAVKASSDATEAALTAVEAREKAAEKAAEAEAARKTATEKATEAEKDNTNATKLSAEAAEADAKASQLEAEAAAANAQATKLEAEAAEKAASAKNLAEAASTAATVAAEQSAAATKAEAAATQAANTSITAKNALLAVLSGKMKAAEAAQIAWNAAMTANPIGTVVKIASVLVGVLGSVVTAMNKAGLFENTLWKKTNKLTDSVDELVESLEESAEAFEDNLDSIESTNKAIDTTLDSLLALVEAEDKSADQISSIQSLVESLNSSMEELNLTYDEEADALSLSTELLAAKAEAYKAQAVYNAYVEQYNELLVEQEQLEQQVTEAQETYYETLMLSADGSAYYVTQANKQKNALADLEEQQASVAEQLEEVTEQMAESYAEQAAAAQEAAQLAEQALAESIANQTVALEDLSEANQETVESLKSTWQGYVDAATEMFEELDDSITLSVEDMIANIQHNQEVVSTWGDNMESLRDRFATLGLDVSILDQLADLGVDGAGYIAALVQASDAELSTLATEFAEGGEIAKTALMQSLGVDSNELPEAIQGLVTEAETSMREAVEAADWASLGESMAEGTAEGLELQAFRVTDTSVDMVLEARKLAGEAVGEGSPATSFIELGENMIAGLAQGLEDTSSVEAAAASAADKAVDAVRAAFDSADFSSIGASAFQGIETAASKSMDTVASTVSKAADKINSTWTSGLEKVQSTTSKQMEKVSSSVTAQMESIQSTMSKQLEKVSSTVATQMEKIQSSVSERLEKIAALVTKQTAQMEADVESTMSGISESVESAMTVSVSAIESGSSRMQSAMSSGMSTMQKSAVSACNSITSSFSGLTDSMYSVGVNAMVGLNNGLVAKKSTVLSTAKSIANSVTSTIKSALKVSSPSKVTEEIGEWTGLGLANGLEDMIPRVEKIGAELAEAMVPAEVADFNSLTFKTAFDGDYTVTVDNDNAETEDMLGLLREILEFLQTDNRIYQIIARLELDGRELAEATVEENGQALARQGQANGNIHRRW